MSQLSHEVILTSLFAQFEHYLCLMKNMSLIFPHSDREHNGNLTTPPCKDALFSGKTQSALLILLYPKLC